MFVACLASVMDLLDDWFTLYVYISDFKLWCICQPDPQTSFEIAAVLEMANRSGENIMSLQGPDWQAVLREQGPGLLYWVPGGVVFGTGTNRLDFVPAELSYSRWNAIERVAGARTCSRRAVATHGRRKAAEARIVGCAPREWPVRARWHG